MSFSRCVSSRCTCGVPVLNEVWSGATDLQKPGKKLKAQYFSDSRIRLHSASMIRENL